MKAALENARQIFELGPRIARSIRRAMKGLPGPELTLAQYRILARVSQGLGKASLLCELQGVSLPAMSRMVDTLVRKGLLKRAPNAEDRRQIVLKLSPAGRKAHDRLKNAVIREIDARLSGLSPAEQASLAGSLSLLETIFP
jgi:DNA-binding MarR family transcriptional regulator